jgi:hypothetical protein
LRAQVCRQRVDASDERPQIEADQRDDRKLEHKVKP